MGRLLKSFKTEINPTEEQKVKIRKTIGTCRFIYNFYLAHNKELHENGERFMSSHQFRIWLKKFFKHQSGFPKFKKKGKSDVKMYFVKNNPKDCRCERHRINIPSLGWVRVKEKGYIPVTKDGYVIKSGSVSMKAGRFYVSVLAEIPDSKITTNDYSEGIGHYFKW